MQGRSIAHILVIPLFIVATVICSADQLKERCLVCHGSNPTSFANQGPELGGFSRDYIRQQLQSFKDGSRGEDSLQGRVMAKEVSKLTSDQIKTIAKWAAKLPHAKSLNFKQNVESDGAVLFKEQCKGCHVSVMGRHFTGSPRLDELQTDYIKRQLHSFKTGNRNLRNPSKHANKMKAVTAELSESQLSDLQDYFEQIKAEKDEY